MNISFEELVEELNKSPKRWLITGCAGFIGSNILEFLLKNNQIVVGLDNFSTGFKHNLEQVKNLVNDNWSNFTFIEGDLRDPEQCQKACKNIDYVLHQGALGSVPRSIKDPVTSNTVNVGGTLNIFTAAKDNNVKRVIFASSSSVYGDDETSPKVEDQTGDPLSPYAVSKKVNELYAKVFTEQYGLEIIGLRYFNVFGTRQNPNGDYAAVIPKWTQALIENKELIINGDGSTSRDFTYIQNVVELNILAATTKAKIPPGTILNGALGDTTSLEELFLLIKGHLEKYFNHVSNFTPLYTDFRPGDIKHSLADISKAKKMISYNPKVKVEEGIKLSVEWYRKNL